MSSEDLQTLGLEPEKLRKVNRLHSLVLGIIRKVDADLEPQFRSLNFGVKSFFALLQLLSCAQYPGYTNMETRMTTHACTMSSHIFLDPEHQHPLCFQCGGRGNDCCRLGCLRGTIGKTDCAGSFNKLAELALLHKKQGAILNGIGFSSDQVIVTLFKSLRNTSDKRSPTLTESVVNMQREWSQEWDGDWSHRPFQTDFKLADLLNSFADLLPLTLAAPVCKHTKPQGRSQTRHFGLRCLGRGAAGERCSECVTQLRDRLSSIGLGSCDTVYDGVETNWDEWLSAACSVCQDDRQPRYSCPLAINVEEHADGRQLCFKCMSETMECLKKIAIT